MTGVQTCALPIYGDAREVVRGGKVDNERIGGRPAFGPEYFPTGHSIERVGREAVDGLGRHADDFTPAKRRGERCELARGAADDSGGLWMGHGIRLGDRGKG